jgi:hypothetical protein
MRENEWQPLVVAHRKRVDPWVSARLARRAVGAEHAVDDFLFDYYPYSAGKLTMWHPGYGIALQGDAALPYLLGSGYVQTNEGVTADLAWLTSRLPRLDVAIRILTGTTDRQPVLGCFGLHEWAMVYGLAQDEVRHTSLPLRVSPDEISATVDTVGLRCTHIDAYRFFTPEASPLNSLEPTRATQPELEQPGCLHASMDLYKLAGWFTPLVSSDLLMDCFENAAQARRVDMRASPYDVSGFDMTPIPVETADGRREYVAAQMDLMEATAPLRARLLEVLVKLQSETVAAGR